MEILSFIDSMVAFSSAWVSSPIGSSLLSIIIGIPFGIFTSLVAWWVLFHYLAPRIEFSPDISKYNLENLGTRYRLKIRNAGKRGVIDLEVFPIIRIKGLNPQLPDNWVNVPLNTSLTNNRISSLKQDMIMTHLPNKTNKFNSGNYPEHIKQKFQSNQLNMEDLFDLEYEVKLVLQIFGYDEFSGSRKLFISKPYTKSNIKYGTFDYKHKLDKTGLQVIEKTIQHHSNSESCC